MDLNPHRLPTSVIPYQYFFENVIISYKIDYKDVDLENFLFSGEEQISLNILSKTSAIMLNAYKITVSVFFFSFLSIFRM